MRSHLPALLLLVPGLSLAQTQPTTYPYLIKGKIGLLNAPAKVYLVNGPQRLDSAVVKQGQFELKGTTAYPNEAALVLERQGRLKDGWQKMKMGDKTGTVFVESPDRVRLFLEPGPIVVTTPDSLRKARITGGPLTSDYQQYEVATKAVSDKMKKGKSQADFDAVMKEYAQIQKVFVQAHPTSWVSLLVLQWMRMAGPPQYAEVAPLYAALTPTQRATPPGQQYGEMLAGLKLTTIGAQAPDFIQLTPTGQAVSLADYRGKYVLLDFWASWCSPCRAENPKVLAAYNALQSKNFTVLGVSIDNNREKWLKAIAEDKLPWTQVSDLKNSNEAAQRYGIQSIPQNFLIDPSGKIIAANLRGDELQAKLAQLLK
ncbi:MAG: AhpC/TSA family protein [Hymenobacter sp.]|nr:MAG: AhpC/TSA family protein [Hymenobacter sp.]